ncbi:Beta-ketoacyl synthase [Penicillium hispanicum]|uniref:Beta-ketoacyl synthase n=1 Tax=Penicillium hispanicum TaxID=1080232 RepID=UPI002541EB81|nr:Beta-ketoacyl synthase [Penicillium hispanicum]KAJ5594738.1 Beta-ketoacyl synthase [Penicillium hispanicum]
MNFLFFGDQTVEKLPAIQQLVGHSTSSRLVRQFLREACDAVQLEIRHLHLEERSKIPNFDSLLRLAEENGRSEEPDEIIATVLMNVARLGELILYAEEDPTILASHGTSNYLLGFCTGEVPAAVAAIARDTSELLELAVEATHIIFRMARELHRRSVMVDRTNGFWARTVLGLAPERVQPILDEYHQSQSVPQLRHACIGFISEGWLTIFGPPTTLQSLFEWSTELQEAPQIKTDARGAVHMGTLPEVDLTRILGNSHWLDREVVPGTTIVSPYNCQPRAPRTLRGLLEEIIIDVGQKPLQLAKAIYATLELTHAHTLRVIMPGYTSHDLYLKKALQNSKIEYSVLTHREPETTSSRRQGSNLIAIVGMSGRFPGTGDVNAFWEGLLEGKRYVQEIPNTRYDLEKWYDATGKQKNSTMARTGTFLDKPGMFDHRMFNMSPREAMQTDVQHRLLMTTSHEALEMAGYSPDGTLATNRDRIASYFGQTSDDWRELVHHQGLDIYYATGNCRAFGPGRLNHHYKWGGPSYSIDAACASSVATVSLACSGLIGRECDMALAGGGSLLLSPAPTSGLSRGGFLSTHGGCQTFQDDADGYVRGEGIGVVVLKRLEDALDDQDNILAVIRGSGRNYSSDATSITHPSAQAQQQLYRSVLEDSGTDPNSISYVEMHGTGTQAGDSMEMTSVLSTFATKRNADNPLTVGAVKASIGHGEAAAGVCALIKTLMMLQTRKIPPQPVLPGPINHRFPDLAARNVHIAGPNMRLRPSPLANGTIRLFLNSFDASGGNSCLLLEEAPPKPEKSFDPRSHHVVTFTARSQKSLVDTKEKYLRYLRQNPASKLADLAYSTTARRIHGVLRSAIVASSIEDVIQILEVDVTRAEALRAPSPSSVVFAFTGQGAQYNGMGAELWKTSATFRNILTDYQTIASAQGLPKFTDLISDETLEEADPDTVRSQLAILALELGLAHLWRSWGVQPAMVLGHSLGEYAALCVAGVLTISDALYLVGARARIVSESATAHEFGMLAVNLNVDNTRDMISSPEYTSCAIACVNAPKMTVVSGPRGTLERLRDQLKAGSIRSTLLSVPYGFHSHQMDPILGQIEDAGQGVHFAAPQIPIVSTLLGTVVAQEGIFSPTYLAHQAREPVNFVGALQALQSSELANPVFVEIGPDPICLGLIKATLGTQETFGRCMASLHHDKGPWESISSSLKDLYMAGVAIDWPAYHQDFKSTVSLLDLPSYAFDEKEFWAPFPDPEELTAERSPIPAQPQPIKPSVQGFPTTTLQRIQDEKLEPSQISVTFESDLSDPNLRTAIQGHAVAGVEICSSSLLLDMALSAVKYAHLRNSPNAKMPTSLTVENCHFHRALTLSESQQTLEVSVHYVPAEKIGNVQYHCRTPSERYELGTCRVLLEARDSANNTFLVRSRMATLKQSAAHQLGKLAVYRLFDNVVRYSAPFHGLEKVYLDGDMQDALAQVNMAQASTAGGHYLFNPFLIDSIVHLAGFLVNSGLRYPAEVACLSTGFEAWHLFKPLDPTAIYTSYTYMEDSPSNKSLVTGDVYIYDGAELVSVITGMQFQKMKKTALSLLLSPSALKNVQTAPPTKLPFDTPATIPFSHTHSHAPATTRTTTMAVNTPATTVSPVLSIADDEEFAKPDIANTLMSIVAREVGCSMSDMAGDVSFRDLGLDSLMAITIISAVHQETGVELPGSFFLDHSTTAEAIAALAPKGAPAAEPRAKEIVDDGKSDSSEEFLIVQNTPPESPEMTSTVIPEPEVIAPAPAPPSTTVSLPAPEPTPYKPAKTVLISGSKTSKELPMFLFADETGSVSKYIQLPPLPGRRATFGVESPYAREPSLMSSCKVEEIAAASLEAIRTVQASGPYLLGGYAFGGLVAYEVARQLLDAGEKVSGLLIIDTPAPTAPIPTALSTSTIILDTLKDTGLMGPATPASRPGKALQDAHFTATVSMLLRYTPKPLEGQLPDYTTILVSQNGLGSSVQSDNQLVSWMNSNRAVSPTLGWDKLVSPAKSQELKTDYLGIFNHPQVGAPIPSPPYGKY